MSLIWWISTKATRRRLNFCRSIRTKKFLQSSIRTARAETRCRYLSSGAILQYLAEKTSRLLPDDAARRWETIQWVYFQMAYPSDRCSVKSASSINCRQGLEDKRPARSLREQSKRLLGVMESRLEGRQWFMADEYTIADVSMLCSGGTQSHRLLWRTRNSSHSIH